MPTEDETGGDGQSQPDISAVEPVSACVLEMERRAEVDGKGGRAERGEAKGSRTYRPWSYRRNAPDIRERM